MPRIPLESTERNLGKGRERGRVLGDLTCPPHAIWLVPPDILSHPFLVRIPLPLMFHSWV